MPVSIKVHNTHYIYLTVIIGIKKREYSVQIKSIDGENISF